ncbi:MAG: toll/interleukin-1 receptor domain-containing protein [Bacteroidales bacterium]|nr:toll/interleukin-1 receptor domain-containing protein [Bacteroidales bacterium]
MKYDVFISYSRKDIAIVDRIEEEMKKYGITYFIDRSEIRLGEDFAKRIGESIYNCEIMLLVWSKDSNQSQFVSNEIGLAIEFQKTIIPFKIGVFQPDFGLAYRLTSTNRIDAVPFNEQHIIDLVSKIAKQLYKTSILKSSKEENLHSGNQISQNYNNNDPVEVLIVMGDRYIKEGNYEKGVTCYKEAADRGDAKAQYFLGKYYQNGVVLPKDLTKAIRYLTLSANQGFTEAEFSLGYKYHKGIGVAKNLQNAILYYKRAADKGFMNAQVNLGFIYETGGEGIEDLSQAVTYYAKAAAQGSALAQSNLGSCYELGKGVGIDYGKAAEYYQKAAAQGDARAMCNLGVFYFYGQGVPKDVKKGIECYQKSAEKGDTVAQTNLGINYEKGDGVCQDYTKAVEYYQKAADQGDGRGMYFLGRCYESGRGVIPDLTLALKYYEMSSQKGYENAKIRLKQLRNQ